MKSVNALLTAIDVRDWDRATALLSGRETEDLVNGTDSLGRTPLMAAAESLWPEMVAHLLQEGARVNDHDHAGYTALNRLTKIPDFDFEDPLVWGALKQARAETEPDLETEEDLDEETRALLAHIAGEDDEVIAARLTETATLLIDAGADVDADPSDGRTALVNAVRHKILTLATLLLDRGADIERRDKWKMTPLLQAAAQSTALERPGRPSGSVGLRFLLERGADPTPVDWRGRNAFALAVEAGGDANVEALLALRDRVDALSPEMEPKKAVQLRPALAAAAGDLAALERALDAPGANVNAATDCGRTPLMWAAARGFADGVRLLLARGANPDIELPFADTAASLAAYYGHREALVALLEKRPKTRGATRALGIAAEKEDHDMITDLLRLGVPVWHKAEEGPVPFQAASLGRPDLLRAMLSFREKLAKAGHSIRLADAAAVGDVELAQDLLDERADWRTSPQFRGRYRDLLGEALWVASFHGQTEMVAWLIGKRAPLDYRHNDSGQTLLHAAAEGGSVEVVRLLLEAGADPNERDAEGYIPEARATKNLLEITQILDNYRQQNLGLQ